MELINNTTFLFANIAGRINFPHHSLTLIIKGTFDLKLNAKAEPAKEQLFPTGDEFAVQDKEQTGSIQYESDFAYFKPCTDLLLIGKCHAPDCEPVTQCDVMMHVGEIRHSLKVFGHRYWENTIGGGSISEPEPFVEMPLNYENAFGGEGFVYNPIGKGSIRGELLPNIEDPNHLISSPGDHPAPAGFGPLHRSWPQRQSLLGTYKGDYLTKRWPWFPEDFNWRYFNAAPPHMQLPGYLNGDEKLIFENLHSTHSHYESQLPGLRLRCFKRSVKPQTHTPVFEEVDMNLDTLWINMEDEKLVLVWRGWTEVLSEEFEEISHLFVTSEPMEQPPISVEQAHDSFKDKLAELEKQWAMLEEPPEKQKTLAEDELVQEGTKTTAETALEEVLTEEAGEPLLDPKNLQTQVDKMLAKLGIDVESLPAEVKQQIQQQQTKIINRLTETDTAKLVEVEREELQAQLKSQLAKLDIDVDNLPAVSEKARLEQRRFMQELGVDEQTIGSEELGQLWEITSALLPKMGLDPEDLSPLIEQAKARQGDIYKQPGNIIKSETLAVAPPTEVELKKKKIAAIKIRAGNRESFAGEDFSGLDLSGLSFKGLDFSGALLIGTNLNNCDLSGAILSHAKLIGTVLTNAKLSGTQLDSADITAADLSDSQCIAANLTASVLANAKLINANLTECEFRFANLTASDLSNANLTDANLTNANFNKANLNDANLFGADLSDALFENVEMCNTKLDQITAKDTIFVAANLSKSRFVAAKLQGADFSAAVLNDANFQGADLTEACLEKVTAKNINLSHATIDLLRASEGSDFSGALLEQAQGKESIWHEANLSGADFKFSKMHGADFTKATLENANCYAADMRFVRFIKANLSNAQMLDMNLFKGSLEKANLTKAVFSGSNLYGVEFLEAHLDHTQLGDANVKATKLQEVV